MINNKCKKLLIIGGAGYVGSAIVSYLIEKGYYVTVLDNLLYKNSCGVLPFLNNEKYEFINSDLINEKKFRKSF